MQIKLIVIVIVIAITQRIFFPLLNRVMPLYLICGRESSYHFRAIIAEVDLVSFSYGIYVTWDQAQFSFRFVNSILASKAKRKRAWYKPSSAKRLRPLFWLIDICWISQPKLLPKVKNDHRSKFSNSSNWKGEAWKKNK